MDTIDIIVSSWREGTKSQYQSYAKKWFEFCKTNKCHIISPPLPLAMQFLSDMYHAGLSYSSINTARSVLSSLLFLENSSIPFGQLPVVKRLMKGIFELRPSFPKYSATWDVNLAFEYIRKHDLVLLKLKDLSYRMAFLLCLLSGQRCQTVSKLFLDNMVVNEDKVTFLITEKLKHTRIGSHQKPLEFMAFPHDKRLCIVNLLKEYLQRTANIRGQEKQLLISFIKPHKAVSRDTISHWIRSFMTSAGVNTDRYGSHSTRAASASHLAAKNFDIKDIMSAVGWSKEETFQKFYHFPARFNYGNAILETL